jgi:hypothetical protein
MSAPRRAGPNAGMALVLVLTVILALAIIGTPFVLSMIMQEKTAVADRARRQAGYGAEGVRNYAISRLFPGPDCTERNTKGGTPYSDTTGEFDVDLRDDRLKDLHIFDPKGTIWGVSASDEQGKINVFTAPERVCTNVRDILNPKVVDLKDVLTIYSARPARWVRPQKIREIGAFSTPAGASGSPGKIVGIRVDNAIQMAPGARVRVTKPGLAALEAKVVRNGIYTVGVHAVETDPLITPAYLNGLVEVEMRHPVNVNTARRETLNALYLGLTITIPGSSTTSARVFKIDAEGARKIADGLVNKRFETWAQFLVAVLALNVDDMSKAAVVANAIDPTNLLLVNGDEGTGTLPFCFTANETVTIEALSSVNSPAGTPMAGVGFREVVDLGPLTMLERTWENQFDFDRMMGPPRLILTMTPTLPLDMAQALSYMGLTGGAYSGYPFGSRMETFPKDYQKGEASDMSAKKDQAADPNFISMRTVHDERGAGGYMYRIEHFDQELDGKKIELKSHDLPWKDALAPMPQRPDLAAGGTEFWIRFDKPLDGLAPIVLFDIRETDTINRISIELDKTDLIFRITDSTGGRGTVNQLDKGWSEIRSYFKPEQETWYHIAAYWKGTKYGHMLLMVDGFVPAKAKWRHVSDDNDMEMCTELVSPMPALTDPTLVTSTVPMKNSGFLVQPTDWPRDVEWHVPLLIGNEVVEYFPGTGQAERGARADAIVYGRVTQDHPTGAKVQVFGYSSLTKIFRVQIRFEPPAETELLGVINMDFANIPATRASCLLKFGIPVGTTVVGEEDDGNGNMVVKAGNRRIKYTIDPTIPQDNTEWPDHGYIRIGREAIHYMSISRETPKDGYFESCTRAQELTLDVDHPNGASIELWSIAVTEADPLPSPTIIQLGTEWFGPVKLATNTPGPAQYWVGCTVDSAVPPLAPCAIRFNRGNVWYTPVMAHTPMERVVPIFACREMDPTVPRANLRHGDPITVTDVNNYREMHTVTHAITIEEINYRNYNQPLPPPPPPPAPPPPPPPRPPPPPIGVENQFIQLAAFVGPVNMDFRHDSLYTRIMKWPSGELPALRYFEIKNPPVKYGPAKATLDEVKNLASSKSMTLRLNQVATPDDTQLQVPDLNGLGVSQQRPSGALLVGEEIVGFATTRPPGNVTRCKRGWLNSTKQVHNKGDLFFNLSFLPISAVRDSVTQESRYIYLTQQLVGQGYSEGYVLLDDEIVGFEGIGQNGVELDPLATFEGTALFRGMFGTAQANHQENVMVFGIPFRYWDGYKEGQFDNRMPYFQTAHAMRNARWGQVAWKHEVPNKDGRLVVHCYLRIDGLGDLTRPNVDDHSAVWHFFKASQNPLGDYVSSRLENGQVEARFFLEYKQGSYWPEHSWKRTMKLSEVRVEYARDTKVLFHEDK